MYQIILYYNFVRIDQPEWFVEDHRRKCESLNLLGRIYVAHEGINGTLAGLAYQIDQYKEFLCSLPGFEKTEFKDDWHDEIPFANLKIKVRPELATLKSSIPLDITQEKGQHLTPEEWRKILETEKDFTLLDVRNYYEYVIGHFDGATPINKKNFYDFPQWLDECNIPKDKKVLMYCTGGIRCEKFSVLMQKKGWNNVFQLQGGILNYANQVGDANYKGKCFVFDDRLAVPVQKNQPEPLGKCLITGIPCDQYVSCASPECNKLFLCSPEGAAVYEGCCSKACMSAPRRRKFDPSRIYEPTRPLHTYQNEE